MVGRIFTYLVLCSVVFHSWGQSLNFEISSSKVSVGERIELKITSSVNGAIEIKTPKEFHFGQSEQSSMQQQLDLSGKLTIQMSYLRDGYFDSPGNFVIGPVILKSGKRVLTSNTLNVNVTKTSKVSRQVGTKYNQRDLQKPVFGTISPNKSKIYEGEALVIESKVLSRFYPDNMSSYRPYSIDGSVSSYELGSPEQINSSKEQIGNIEWQAFSFDRKVFFVNKKGTIKIKPFEINLEVDFRSLNLKSNSLLLEVLPLPEKKPIDYIGVVGEVEFSCDLKSQKISKGENLTFKIEIKGKGNIQNALNPIIKVPVGWKENAKPIATSKYTFTEEGAEGTLTYEYSYECLSNEPTTWEPISVSYFDPKAGAFKTIKSKEIVINGNEILENNLNESNNIENDQSKTELIQNATNIEKEETIFKNPFLWLTLMSIIAFAFFIGFIGRLKFKKKNNHSSSKPFVVKNNLVEHDIEKAKISFNNNEKVDAIHYLENAVSKAISIHLKVDYREYTTASLVGLFNSDSQNKSLKDAIKDFYANAEILRYGFEITQENWDNVLIQTENLKKELI